MDWPRGREMHKSTSKNLQRRRDQNPKSGVYKPSPRVKRRTLAPTKEEIEWEKGKTAADRAWLAENEKK